MQLGGTQCSESSYFKGRKTFAQADMDVLNNVLPAGDPFTSELDLDTIIPKYDKVHQMGKLVNGGGGYPAYTALNLSFKGLGKIIWAESADTGASVNPWYLVVYRVDESTANTGPTTISMSARLMFKDA